MAFAVRYAHTNIVARDWQRLARFYTEVFDCRPVGPERDLGGDWLSAATAVPDARLRGQHLLLPGHGDSGPTLEIYTYEQNVSASTGVLATHAAVLATCGADTLARTANTLHGSSHTADCGHPARMAILCRGNDALTAEEACRVEDGGSSSRTACSHVVTTNSTSPPGCSSELSAAW